MDSGERKAVHLIFSRWMILALAVAIISPWLLIAFLLAPGRLASGRPKLSAAVDGGGGQDNDSIRAAMSASGKTVGDQPPEEWVPGKEGPWGRIESMLFAIDVPDEFVFVPPADQPPVRWSFPGYTKEKVLATLRSVGVPEEEVKRLESSAKWTSDDGVTAVEPGDPLILALAPEVRSKLYAILVVFPQNSRQIDPVWFTERDGRLALQGRRTCAGVNCPAEAVAVSRRATSCLLFADFEPALRNLPSDAERKRFMKVVSRKRAVMARLVLGPDDDVEKMAQYWGIGGRRKDVFPFLSALHRVEKGCVLNVVCLLPDFARDHLYRHPFASADDKGVKQDCFWSAFNFFNDPPDNRFNDMGYVREVLDRDYYEVQTPSQLGDLVFVTAGGKTVIHVAAYVADDLVFTKNGEDFRQPWLLMHMADMMETYAVKYPSSGALRTQFFRKKSL